MGVCVRGDCDASDGSVDDCKEKERCDVARIHQLRGERE